MIAIHMNVEYPAIDEGIHESSNNNADACQASFTCDVTLNTNCTVLSAFSLYVSKRRAAFEYGCTNCVFLHPLLSLSLSLINRFLVYIKFHAVSTVNQQ